MKQIKSRKIYPLHSSQVKESDVRSSSAHTLGANTMPKTCATIATTVKERAKWPMPVDTQTNLTTLAECAKTATSPSTTSKGKKSRTRSSLAVKLS